GIYDFRHCTFANYFRDAIRQDPNLAVTNYYLAPDEVLYIYNTDAYFGNSIIYGNRDEEILLDYDEQGEFKYKFENCLLKTTMSISDQEVFPGSIRNQQPLFVDVYKNNMALDTLSPGIDQGSFNVINGSAYPTFIDKDILGISRIASPDIGAYEYIPE
ncbi:MAG TPA: choice-of-anchor Q domain-containing protein, partial [Bacteroidales bacterium]|nr:choice-of-anchor Q domain-containing protein [Bacteroidales bacterium]